MHGNQQYVDPLGTLNKFGGQFVMNEYTWLRRQNRNRVSAEMFTRKNFKALALATNLAWYSGVVAYRFEKSMETGKYRLVFINTKFRKLLVQFTLVLNLFYAIFIAFRVFQKVVLEAEEASLPFLVKMAYLLSAYTLPVVLQINTILYWEETSQFLVQYIKFFKKVQEKYLLPSEGGAKCMKFFSAVFVIGILVTLQNVGIILRKPYTDHMLTSLLENPKKTSFIIRLPFIACNLWIWANTWTNIWAYCFHQYLYITCAIFVTKELDIDVVSPRTCDRLRTVKICPKVLRSLQALHQYWGLNFQQWFCPSHKATVGCIATFALYGVIKLSGPRSVVMGFVALLSLMYLSTFFYKFGKVNESSETTLRNWTTAPSSTKYMKKFIASVPVFKIQIGDFYYIKKTTVVTVLYTVLSNTITLFFL